MWAFVQILFDYFITKYSLRNILYGDRGSSAPGIFTPPPSPSSPTNHETTKKGKTRSTYITSYDSKQRTVTTIAAPGLMTLLDTALYRAHEGQLTATISSANATLVAFLQLKSHAKSLLHTCYTLPPPPPPPSSTSSSSSSTSSSSMSSSPKYSLAMYHRTKKHHLETIANIVSFATYCIECTNEAIQSITTDNLSKSANLEPVSRMEYPTATTPSAASGSVVDVNVTTSATRNHTSGGSGAGAGTATTTRHVPSASPLKKILSPSIAKLNENKRLFVEQSIISSKYNYWNDVGLRSPVNPTTLNPSSSSKNNTSTTSATTTTPVSYCNQFEIRKNECWESEKIFCPDYVWADHSMIHCQRMVRSMMKHDGIELMMDFLCHGNPNGGGTHTGSSGSGSTSGYGHGHGGNSNSFGGGSQRRSSTNSHTSFQEEKQERNDNHDHYHQNTKQQSQQEQQEQQLLPFLTHKKMRCKLNLLITNIISILKNDLPLRLHQYRCGIERDTSVTKRLYLLKNECRAPFRSFLEGHDYVQRAPDLDLLNDYIALYGNVNGNGNGNGKGNENKGMIGSATTRRGRGEGMAEIPKGKTGGIGGTEIPKGKKGDQSNDGDNSSTSTNGATAPTANNTNTPNTSTTDGESKNINEELKIRKKRAERKIQECIHQPRFQEALTMEAKCEIMEVEMGVILFPFCNLARVLLDGKGVFHLVKVTGIELMEDEDEILNLQELLRRLKSILCKKLGVDTSTGIRPLLQDLQGIPRDPSPFSMERNIFGDYSNTKLSKEEAFIKRLDKLCQYLLCLHEICKIKGGFGVDRREFDNLPSTMKTCAVGVNIDHLQLMCKEWYNLSIKQQKLSKGGQGNLNTTKNDNMKEQTAQTDSDGTLKQESALYQQNQSSFKELAEEMRKAEMELRLAMASRQALSVVQQRIYQIESDKEKRFQILQEMLKEVCLREMDFELELKKPDKHCVLELPKIETVSGIFDPVLEVCGEI